MGRVLLTLGVLAVLAAILVWSFPQRRHIFALARLTFLDALRKKVLVVFILFAALLIVVSQFFPVFRVEDRLRVVQSVCYWSISTFGMIVAIFLAALSLPGDFSEKTIYTIATKPVRRGSLVLGKVLGFAALSGLILALMGGASLIAIRYVDAQVRHETGGPSRLFARWSIPPVQSYITGPGLARQDGRTLVNGEAQSAYVWFFPHPALFAKPGGPLEVKLAARFARQPSREGPLPLSFQWRRGEKWAEPFSADVEPERIWQHALPLSAEDFAAIGRGTVFEVAVGPRTPFMFQADHDDLVLLVNDVLVKAEKQAPRAEGLSPKRTITWISQAPGRQVVWRFHKLKKTAMPQETIEGFADVRVSAAGLGPRRVDLRFAFSDPADPAKKTESIVTATRDRVTRFSFPASAINPDGSLLVSVERADKDTYLGLPDDLSVGIYGEAGIFEWNFAKSLFVIFFQLTLLSAVAVAGSTFLSAPVSVLFAFFIFFCGNLVDFMRNAATILAWGASPHSHSHDAAPAAEAFFHWVWDGITKLIEIALPAAARILPDLQQFDVAGRVMSSDEIPLGLVFNAFVYFAAFGLFAVVVGQIVLKNKEME